MTLQLYYRLVALAGGVWGEFDVTSAGGGHAGALGGYIWRSGGSQAPQTYPRHVLNERDSKGV